MITSEHCQLMARYNEWMNSRLYAVCANLPEAELCKDRGAFFKSIYLTLNHIAYGDLAFMSRFTGVPAVVPEPGVDLDMKNNYIGRWYGNFGKVCPQACMNALSTGELQTKPFDGGVP